MAEVWGLNLKHNEQLILLALADHGDDDGANIWPSLAHLAWKTGYSRRQVKTIMSDLRKRGVLRVEKAATWRHPPVYRLNLNLLPKKAPWLRGEETAPLKGSGGKFPVSRGGETALRGEVSGSRGEVATAPESSPESSPEPLKESARARPESLEGDSVDAAQLQRYAKKLGIKPTHVGLPEEEAVVKGA